MTATAHRCHALGCQCPCPPRWLMCRVCWARVPLDLQRRVYRTVGLRGASCDETWAPWWRAQARAVAHVAVASGHFDAGRATRYVARADEFADELEAAAEAAREAETEAG